MSKYSECYKKIFDGYTKIIACIDSCDTIEQTQSITNLVESWVGLIDFYCDLVWDDRSNRHRKADAISLGEVSKMMFDEVNVTFSEKMKTFIEPEYEASFKPVRIKGLPEIVQEYNNEYDDYDFGYQQGCCDVNKEEDDE